MLHITVESHEWLTDNLIGENHLANKITFNQYLLNVIAHHLKSYEDCEKTIITLPDVVSKVERYQIHKFTKINELDPQSYDTDEGERIMKITLSKKYVQDLFKDYEFPIEVEENINETPTEIALKSDKQMLFEIMLEFIEKNLSDEFQKYLKTI
jgi:hypothetical protein